MADLKIPFVKEWGSWIVFISASIAALIAGSITGQSSDSELHSLKTVLAILGLAFLINSKNPLTALLRPGGRSRDNLLWSLFFATIGLIMLLPVITEGIKPVLIALLLVISYIMLLLARKEHSLAAEFNGFALLTMAAPVVYFAITGEVSLRLYVCALLFFGAGVFKVKIRLKKSVFYRSMMVLYIVISAGSFILFDIPLILLLPLLENLISALYMRDEGLRTTGYIEMTKGIVFLVLMGFFWY